jgi:ABC-type nitrate/sulfonate/bicarbonate transport system substrate-binding protein
LRHFHPATHRTTGTHPNQPCELRGKQIGVRVIGAGIWISTILALEQLGLDPRRGGITTVPIGSPVQILRALEEGTIDAALVSVKQSHELEAKGFSVLLKDYPTDISSFGGGLVVATSYQLAHPDVVENVVTALIEALAFTLAEKNKVEVMQALKSSLNITDADTAASNLAELKRKPYTHHTRAKRAPAAREHRGLQLRRIPTGSSSRGTSSLAGQCGRDCAVSGRAKEVV